MKREHEGNKGQWLAGRIARRTRSLLTTRAIMKAQKEEGILPRNLKEAYEEEERSA